MDLEFKRYQHIEYLKSEETDGIFNGTVYIEPKIDGANTCIWSDRDDNIHIGSRNRELYKDECRETGQHHVYNGISEDEAAVRFARAHKNYVVYGEFLQPHHIRYYEKEAYYKFYIFDVWDREQQRYLEPEIWMDEAKNTGCHIVPILAKLDKCSELPEYHTDEKWDYLVDINRFLIPDSCDKKAEGLVFKNYGFINKFGRNQVFGKIVTDAFKRGPKISKIPTEQKDDDTMQKLVLKYYPPEISTKVFSDISIKNGKWDKKLIPELIGRCFHDFVTDCIWTIITKEKLPVIDFRKLRHYVSIIIKNHVPSAFL